MSVASPPRAPLAPPPRPPGPVALGRRPPAPAERTVNCTAAWTLIGVLCAFKIATIALVFALAYPTHRNVVPMLAAMNWPWLIVLAVLLSVIPFGFWYRLVRVRARRRRLQHAEWHVS